MISWFLSSSPASGSVLAAQSLEPVSVLTAQSLERALDSVSPSLSALPPLMLCLSVSLSLSKIKINIKKIFLNKKIKKIKNWYSIQLLGNY